MARRGVATGGGWHVGGLLHEGTRFDLRCSGPDLPATVPDELVSPTDVSRDPKWRGNYRLVVAAPLITLDLCWQPGEPLRIFVFSRGDWEALLLALAGTA